MKKLITCLLLIIAFGCNTSDDELIPQNDVQYEMSEFHFDKIYDMIQSENAKLNENNIYSKSSSESKNNGNGVYIVPFYSDSGSAWYAAFQIPQTNKWIFIDFPQNGDDKAIVFSENEMMINFTMQGPSIRIVDYEQNPPWGSMVYFNYCDENKTGLYKIRGRTTYNPMDPNNDGVIDYYHWGPNTNPSTEVDKNFLIHIKSTLIPFTQENGWCTAESVELSYIAQLRNGNYREVASID